MSILSPGNLFLLMMALLGLFTLWQVIASDHGVAQSCFFAGYWPLAIVVRLGRPVDHLAPIWAPFLYPYTWGGIAALFWASSQLRPTRLGLEVGNTPRRMAALYLALLALHLGLACAAPFSHGHALSLYLMVPPAMALLVGLLYLAFSSLLRPPLERTLAWPMLAATTVLLPLAWVKVCEQLVPAVLRSF